MAKRQKEGEVDAEAPAVTVSGKTEDANATPGALVQSTRTDVQDVEFLAPVAEYPFENALVFGAGDEDGSGLSDDESMAGSVYSNPKRKEDGVLIMPEQRFVAAVDTMGAYHGGPLVGRAILRGFHVGVLRKLPLTEIADLGHRSLVQAAIEHPEWNKQNGATMAVLRRNSSKKLSGLEGFRIGDARIYVCSIDDDSVRYVSPDQNAIETTGGVDRFYDRLGDEYKAKYDPDPRIAKIQIQLQPPGVWSALMESMQIENYKPPTPVSFPGGKRLVGYVCSDGISGFIGEDQVFEIIRTAVKEGQVAMITVLIQREARRNHNQPEGYDLFKEGLRVHVRKNHTDDSCGAVITNFSS